MIASNPCSPPSSISVQMLVRVKRFVRLLFTGGALLRLCSQFWHHLPHTTASSAPSWHAHQLFIFSKSRSIRCWSRSASSPDDHALRRSSSQLVNPVGRPRHPGVILPPILGTHSHANHRYTISPRHSLSHTHSHTLALSLPLTLSLLLTNIYKHQ